MGSWNTHLQGKPALEGARLQEVILVLGFPRVQPLQVAKQCLKAEAILSHGWGARASG